MRLVIDTNVFISILIKPGTELSALIDYIDRGTTVLYSPDTLGEIVTVLRRSKFAKYTTARKSSDLVRWIVGTGERVSVEKFVTGSRDTADNKFLSLAIAGRADCLISGDKDLLVLGHIEGIPILSPADFMRAAGH